MTCQFRNDQGAVTLTGELSTSSASVVEARFTGHGGSPILWVKRDCFGMNWIASREVIERRAILVCLELVNTFVKDETSREVQVMEYIKQKDRFGYLKQATLLLRGPWKCPQFQDKRFKRPRR